jgi:hypothetical protein
VWHEEGVVKTRMNEKQLHDKFTLKMLLGLVEWLKW